LAQARWGKRCDLLKLIAATPWWSAPARATADALQHMWWHGVAVALAARRLAREAGDPEPARLARAGLLHGLGRWAAAAVAPESLAQWLGEGDAERRRALECERFGVEFTSLGRHFAERWGCDPVVVDAAWLHAERDASLSAAASDPARLALIQQAYALAERTPWALRNAGPHDLSDSDPRLRLLMAEVQVRCSAAFIEPDATAHEEAMTRSNAGLRRQVAELLAGRECRDALLHALADADPSEAPTTWADRAGLGLCTTPGVATARVIWTGPGATAVTDTDSESSEGRPSSRKHALTESGQRYADILLWDDRNDRPPLRDFETILAGWRGWARLVADRARVSERLEKVLRAHRDHVRQEGPRQRRAKLDALAEFAAGAGHELNNPLAVIVGRAQLLLARESEPSAVRSLRAILAQAQRAHRILRDLMFVARTPEPRPRTCQPDEILRASLRDFKPEADARGVRLVAESTDAGTRAWADADALRHVADVLIRNAIESTPKGGSVRVRAAGDRQALRWTIHDDGRGISLNEAEHLFDPFYCGRQAGRGLGLGLPRAERIVTQAGGELRWHSVPGHGTIFQVHVPLTAPPKPPPTTPDQVSPSSRNDVSVPTP
jgi:signal transduction histidine kinase